MQNRVAARIKLIHPFDFTLARPRAFRLPDHAADAVAEREVTIESGDFHHVQHVFAELAQHERSVLFAYPITQPEHHPDDLTADVFDVGKIDRHLTAQWQRIDDCVQVLLGLCDGDGVGQPGREKANDFPMINGACFNG